MVAQINTSQTGDAFELNCIEKIGGRISKWDCEEVYSGKVNSTVRIAK
jgi:hypothetical protein